VTGKHDYSSGVELIDSFIIENQAIYKNPSIASGFRD